MHSSVCSPGLSPLSLKITAGSVYSPLVKFCTSVPILLLQASGYFLFSPPPLVAWCCTTMIQLLQRRQCNLSLTAPLADSMLDTTEDNANNIFAATITINSSEPPSFSNLGSFMVVKSMNVSSPKDAKDVPSPFFPIQTLVVPLFNTLIL